MPGQGLDHIHIEGEKLLALDDVLGMPKAREMAQAQKIKAFGLLAGLLSRPKEEDIEIIYEEKRFDAFWHVLGTSRFEYKRRKIYKVPVDATVQDVEVLGATLKTDMQAKSFGLDGIERCIEEYKEETTIDAQTDQPGDFSKYLKLPNKQISSTDELTADGTPIVALETKPAFLVRKTINSLIKPIQADQILDEQIGIREFALYFLPIYTFEFLWKTKDKRVTISFDGATGELRPKANKITQKLRSSFTNAEIFEFSKEVANFVPGGSLAMLVGKKAYEMTKKP
jgi:hypothetical protein